MWQCFILFTITLKKFFSGSSHRGTAETNLTSIHEDAGSFPGVAVSCVGYRHGSDPALLWLWCRLATVAPILPLAWELPYSLKRKKKSVTMIQLHIEKYQAAWVYKQNVKCYTSRNTRFPEEHFEDSSYLTFSLTLAYSVTLPACWSSPE